MMTVIHKTAVRAHSEALKILKLARALRTDKPFQQYRQMPCNDDLGMPPLSTTLQQRKLDLASGFSKDALAQVTRTTGQTAV